MDNHTIQNEAHTSSYYKSKAKSFLKGNYWVLVLVSLIAVVLGAITVPTYYSDSIFVSDVTDAEVEQWSSEFATADEVTADMVWSFIKHFLVVNWQQILIYMAIASAISFAVYVLVGSPLNIGMHRVFLNRIDGKADAPQTEENNFDGDNETDKETKKADVGATIKTLFVCFTDSKLFVKSVLLNLFTALVVWAPAVIASIVSSIVLAVSLMTELEIVSLVGLLLFMAIMIAGWVLTVKMGLGVSFCGGIMCDRPELGVIDIVRESVKLMKGNKMRYFGLGLSFFGWYILASLVSFSVSGISIPAGGILLMPYVFMTEMLFYDDISQRRKWYKDAFSADDYNPFEA